MRIQELHKLLPEKKMFQKQDCLINGKIQCMSSPSYHLSCCTQRSQQKSVRGGGHDGDGQISGQEHKKVENSVTYSTVTYIVSLLT